MINNNNQCFNIPEIEILLKLNAKNVILASIWVLMEVDKVYQ